MTLVAAFAVIPHTPPAEASGRIGVIGTVWMVAWIAAILLALTQGSIWGNRALIPLAIGVVGGALWLLAERRSSAAVFDVAILRSPYVITVCLVTALFAAVNAAFFLVTSTYCQVIPEFLAPEDSYGLGRTDCRPAGS